MSRPIRRSTREAELTEEINRLTSLRDAQPPDTLYALSYQAEIDAAAAELAAWRLNPQQMTDAAEAVRDAGRRLQRAQTGRSRWPVTAAVTGTLGAAATVGGLAADSTAVPLAGGGLLIAAAAAALALTIHDRARDARDAETAAADLDEADTRYAALIREHEHAIAPFRAALPAPDQEGKPCSQQPDTTTPTTTSAAGVPDRPASPAQAPQLTPNAAATDGRPPIASPTSAAGTSPASTTWSTTAPHAKAS